MSVIATMMLVALLRPSTSDSSAQTVSQQFEVFAADAIGMRTPLDDPKVMKKLAVACFAVSIIEWVFATLFGWVYLVAYVSHLSQLTFTISLIPWIQGLRVEARQVEEDIPNEVAERVIERTNLEPANDEAPPEGEAS